MQIQAARAVLGTDPERTDAVLAQAQQPATARPWARDSRS
jgi:hypothetical protein